MPHVKLPPPYLTEEFPVRRGKVVREIAYTWKTGRTVEDGRDTGELEVELTIRHVPEQRCYRVTLSTHGLFPGYRQHRVGDTAERGGGHHTLAQVITGRYSAKTLRELAVEWSRIVVEGSGALGPSGQHIRALALAPAEGKTCRHCGRGITYSAGRWIDPEATGDDDVWGETCDANDTFTAEHEPTEG